MFSILQLISHSHCVDLYEIYGKVGKTESSYTVVCNILHIFFIILNENEHSIPDFSPFIRTN